jgi:hypothetical protein
MRGTAPPVSKSWQAKALINERYELDLLLHIY